MRYHVLVTDYAWPNLDIERRILAAVDAELIVAETGNEEELIRLAAQADAILTSWKRVTEAVLDAAPRCKIVSRYGVGLDNIAVDHATRLGILVSNVPDFCREEVSDHAMALLMACARNVVLFARDTHQGIWDLSAGQRLARVRGQTLGLVGYGSLAQAMVPKALGFGLKIIAYTPRLSADALSPFGTATNDLKYLLKQADYVSLHVPATKETCGLMNRETLRMMKPTAYLINTSRGALIDESALLEALTDGWIAGAALDVLTNEPPEPTQPLLKLDNVIVTPHAAFYSVSAIEELEHKAAENVAQVLRGERPSRVVNGEVLRRANCRL